MPAFIMRPILPEPDLSERIHDSVLEAICSGELKSGARITQEELAHQFGVSRQPVLQAMMLPLVMQQNLTSLMIVTLGFGYVFTGGASKIFGGDPQAFVSPLTAASIRFGDVWFTWADVVTLVGTLILFAVLWLVLNRTRTGAIVRSVAEDPKLAQLFGINAALVYIGVFVFECAAVALGAGLVAPRSPILTSMGFDEVILTFVIVVLGGIGSVGGSLLAGFGLGMFTALFGALVSPAHTTAAAFFVLLAVLVLRPGGLATK